MDHFTRLVVVDYQFIHCIVYCVCLSCVVLFGLMATRLNKHYY